jgi:hypothetical protein
MAVRRPVITITWEWHWHPRVTKPAAKREIELVSSISTKPNTQFSEADDARKALATHSGCGSKDMSALS